MSTVAVVGRLGCVFALLGLVLWLLRRTGGLPGRRAAALQVVSTTRLGKSTTLSVVRVHDEEYVLGVSGSGVTVVSSRPAPAAPGAGTAGPAERPDATAPAPRAAVPPTPAEFLRASWQVLRKRPLEASDVAPDAVAGALAGARTPAAAPATAPGDPAPVDTAPGNTAPGDTAPGDTAPGDSAPAAPGPTAGSPPDRPGAPLVHPAAFAADLAAALAAQAAAPHDHLTPAAADGPAAPTSRQAPRRLRYRTDARPGEELDPWSRTPSTARPTAEGTARV